MDAKTAEFFRYWREKYQWPQTAARSESERLIARLTDRARTVVGSPDLHQMLELLRDIHYWKTQNRSGTTDRYERALHKRADRTAELQQMLPLPSAPAPSVLVRFLDLLRIEDSNLPTGTAQLSFLSGRRFPVLDRFVAQFLSRNLDLRILKWREFDFPRIFETISKIDFGIEVGPNGQRRLAVYTEPGYCRNRDLYVNQLIPSFDGLVEQLRTMRVTYLHVDGAAHDFSSADVEMAFFAFATHNRAWFENF